MNGGKKNGKCVNNGLKALFTSAYILFQGGACVELDTWKKTTPISFTVAILCVFPYHQLTICAHFISYQLIYLRSGFKKVSSSKNFTGKLAIQGLYLSNHSVTKFN